MTNRTILIAEDEAALAETLQYRLVQEGYTVLTAGDGQQAVDLVRSRRPDLLILDLMLPQMDGLEVCRILRKEAPLPILILTAKGEEIDKVVGLEVGADDYVTKPFSMRELLARVKALLRRTEAPPAPGAEDPAGREVLRSGTIRIDVASHVAWKHDRRLDLKPREFELLAFLMRNPNRAFTRDHLLDRVWGYENPVDARTVDVHVRWLREKIEDDPSHPQVLVTVRGVGYRFEG